MKSDNALPDAPTKQLRVNYEENMSFRWGRTELRELTWTAKAVLPTPPSPSTATLQLSIANAMDKEL
jgi:hypothetical protein